MFIYDGNLIPSLSSQTGASWEKLYACFQIKHETDINNHMHFFFNQAWTDINNHMHSFLIKHGQI